MKLTDELIAKISQLPTGNIADSNTVRGVLDTAIKPVNPHVHMVGRAFTVDCQPGDNLAIHQAMYEAEPGDVLFLAFKGFDQAGHFGDMMANACKVRGLAGVVIDGSCRDYQDIYELEYPVYSRGYNPAPTVKESLAKMGQEITIGGVTIHQGDLVVGDCDGIVIIPKEDEDKVMEKAFAKFEREKKILADIKAGKSTLDIYGFRELIADKQVGHV
ncbi:RraA family protein [Streptococcus cristatus]|uniref:Putative 4-hydroxy-4-methyl-2-oxoglutarate aldolase n=1 Tax=Streptococcus cristatus TaxID=45634 RepID=A0A139N596_STRCR|nr:RraA family protein [Streptococcus cristatus]KXT70921.1 Demethylmenaquinone methyltransferase [Streptococcus cristatus]